MSAALHVTKKPGSYGLELYIYMTPSFQQDCMYLRALLITHNRVRWRILILANIVCVCITSLI